jgi:hypothetical protein
VPGPAACSGAENGGVAHTPLCVATQGGPRRVIRHGVARGTRVATLAGMNTTRTIEATLDVSTHAESSEAPIDALATKVFAATMAYVVIFITVAVLLIAV